MATTKVLAESGGDYDNMALMEATEQGDLTTMSGFVCGIEGTWTGADTTAVVWAGWANPTATDFVTINTDADSKATMPYGTTNYRLELTTFTTVNSVTLQIDLDYTVVNDLQVRFEWTNSTSDRFHYALKTVGANIAINGGYYVGDYNNAANSSGGVSWGWDTSGTATFTNVVGKRLQSGAGKANLFGCLTTTNGTVFNNCLSTTQADANTLLGLYTSQGSGVTTTYTNCIGELNGKTGATTTLAFWGRISGVLAGDYNATDDTTGPGANSRDSQTFTFVDQANGDYHLDAADAGARTFGTDLSGTFTTDFDGETRVNWDIGADEDLDAVVAGAADRWVELFGIDTPTVRPIRVRPFPTIAP